MTLGKVVDIKGRLKDDLKEYVVERQTFIPSDCAVVSN